MSYEPQQLSAKRCKVLWLRDHIPSMNQPSGYDQVGQAIVKIESSHCHYV